jgi:hypothetical protein
MQRSNPWGLISERDAEILQELGLKTIALLRETSEKLNKRGRDARIKN